jgi:hypothetical protein
LHHARFYDLGPVTGADFQQRWPNARATKAEVLDPRQIDPAIPRLDR